MFRSRFILRAAGARCEGAAGPASIIARSGGTGRLNDRSLGTAMTHYPELPPIYYERPRRRGPRMPWIGGGFLLLVGAFVVSFLVSSDVRDATRQVAANGATWVAEKYGMTEEPRETGVPAEDFTPERGAFASAAGANVRDYPLPNADILTRLPSRAELNITGRLNVQGNWWYRVVLADGRIGFVHQSVVAWGRPPAAPAQVANVTEIDPEISAAAGRAGAKVRTSPSRSARVIVRVDAGAGLTVTGRRRVGEHTWYRVRTEDGREGFARDDVLVASDGGRLRV